MNDGTILREQTNEVRGAEPAAEPLPRGLAWLGEPRATPPRDLVPGDRLEERRGKANGICLRQHPDHPSPPLRRFGRPADTSG